MKTFFKYVGIAYLVMIFLLPIYYPFNYIPLMILNAIIGIICLLISYTWPGEQKKYVHHKWFGGKGLLTEKEYGNLLAFEYALQQGFYNNDSRVKLEEQYESLSNKAQIKSTILQDFILFFRNIPSFPGLVKNWFWLRYIYPYQYPDRFKNTFRISAYISKLVRTN